MVIFYDIILQILNRYMSKDILIIHLKFYFKLVAPSEGPQGSVTGSGQTDRHTAGKLKHKSK